MSAEVIVWLGIMILMLVIEVVTLGLTTIWFAGGALVATLLALLDVPILVQIIVFLIVSGILVYFTRPIAVKKFNKTRTLTNVESVAGKQAVVSETIDNVNGTGKIMLDGMEWTARTKEDGTVISEGKLISVISVEGVKAIVEEAKED